MKLTFNFKDKKAEAEADLEKVLLKKLELDDKNPHVNEKRRKSHYQMRQEEKRKTMELKRELERQKREQENKERMKYMFILLGIAGFCLLMAILAPLLGL